MTLTEAEKYEVLEKIGTNAPRCLKSMGSNKCTGHGSFGIIHKVRRISDNKVHCSLSLIPKSYRLTTAQGNVSQRDQLCPDVSEGARATPCRVLYPQFPSPPKHCRLLPPGTPQGLARASYLHGVLQRRRSEQGDQIPRHQEPICRGGICLEHLRATCHRIIPVPLWC